MDLTLTAEELAFRDELRDWLSANNPGAEPKGPFEEVFAYRREWQARLHSARYAGLSWPREYGGRGATLMEQAIFGEEMTRAKAPMPANVIGLAMGGPVVLYHGTPEQRARYLDPILSADEIWCQGFSEPDAGSDLASLKTRATKVDGGWRVSGQKVWTSFARQAKWMMLLARTDPSKPKHEGLSYFLLDMEQDAVEVRPLRQITGESEFNEVFFEDAFVPDENIVGSEGQGWMVAITTLMHERAGLGASASVGIQMELQELAQLAVERGLAQRDDIRQRFAALYVKAQTMRLNGYRGLSAIIARGVPGPEGSLVKWQWADINQALTELAMELRGTEALVASEPWTYRYYRARANSIEGGTTEVLKNILAERVLGLPKLR